MLRAILVALIVDVPRLRARNGAILIWVNGDLVPRERAVVSVFDAAAVARACRPAYEAMHARRVRV